MPLTDAPDTGPDGPAALARDRTRVRVDRIYRGAADRDGEAVEAVRVLDTLHDRMHAIGQLSDRQYSAACEVTGLWHAAGLDVRRTGRYGEGDGVTLREDGPTALDRHREALRGMPAHHAVRVDAMCMGQHPGTWGLESLQAGLDYLADLWGFER